VVNFAAALVTCSTLGSSMAMACCAVISGRCEGARTDVGGVVVAEFDDRGPSTTRKPTPTSTATTRTVAATTLGALGRQRVGGMDV
jgi:hypothetical protein